MRTIAAGFTILIVAASLQAADAPLVEHFLHRGDLANGEQALGKALDLAPDDDQLRFSLAMVQFVRGVERLGQALHEYGIKDNVENVPFLRLPVPVNADPAPIHYLAFRRLLDDFVCDLEKVEATLASMTDEEVKLPLRLAEVRLDLDSDGRPTDRLLDVVKKLMGEEAGFLKDNPEFLVCFDRGDAAWLQAYCHLLMGMLDWYLAFDSESEFDLWAGDYFAKTRQRCPAAVSEEQKQEQTRRIDELVIVVVKEPIRLGRSRKHFIRVAELNHDTWKYIRAEKDDDHEWLPSPAQKGVLGLPVRNEQIDAWLRMMSELKELFQGNRTLPRFLTGFEKSGKGINLKSLLVDPPLEFRINGELAKNLPDKYFSDEKDLNLGVLFSVWRVFQDTTSFGLGYAVWFN